MKTIKNQKENYSTRSKIGNKSFKKIEENKAEQLARETFSVEPNGYFVWAERLNK